MRDTPERDLAVANELGRMADARIKELESENTALREQLAHQRQRITFWQRHIERMGKLLGTIAMDTEVERAVKELQSRLAQVEKERDDLRDSVKTRPSHWEPDPRHWQPVPDNEQVTVDTNCEACDAGYRLAKDGLHYNDEHGGRTWGVCRKVVASLDKEQP